jgi:hypothetical protein
MILKSKCWNWRFSTTLMLFFAIFNLTAAAQNERTIQGVVLDETKSPLAGVTIQVKDTDVRTSTGADGKFTITVPAGKNVLIYSYVGKETLELNIAGQNSVSATLKGCYQC